MPTNIYAVTPFLVSGTNQKHKSAETDSCIPVNPQARKSETVLRRIYGNLERRLRTIVAPGDPPILPLPEEGPEAAPSFLYFAYGSNMSTARLKVRTPSARAMGTAVLSGHVLRFHKRSMDQSGKCDAFETGDDADRVIGILYAIDSAERKKLDAAEGLNKGYRDATVTVVDAQGRRKKALVYLATPDFIDGSLKPYSWYRDHVLAGSVEHALPAEYVREFVESVEAQPDQNQERERRERSV